MTETTAPTLARIGLLRGLDPAEVRRLGTRVSWRRWAAGEQIIGFGDESTDVYFVVAGDVRVLVHSPTGKVVILRDIRAGEFFGELAAIDGQPRSAAIEALTAATVARMPAGVFREIIHRHPSVCDEVLGRLAARIRTLANRVTEFSTLDVRRRIYAELLRLARRQADGGGSVISPPPLHVDLAARVSTHREAVTRELNSLEREGLVLRRKGALVLLNPAALAARIEDLDEA